jgi:hypothetical protein
MIDHHESPSNVSKYLFSDTKYGSTCEMVYKFLDQNEWLDLLDKDMATAIYTGILTDSGSFRFPKTLKRIRTHAFKDCPNLEEVIFSTPLDEKEMKRAVSNEGVILRSSLEKAYKEYAILIERVSQYKESEYIIKIFLADSYKEARINNDGDIINMLKNPLYLCGYNSANFDLYFFVRMLINSKEYAQILNRQYVESNWFLVQKEIIKFCDNDSPINGKVEDIIEPKWVAFKI